MTGPLIPRRSPLRYIVLPMLVGGVVGIGVAFLPDPWPLVALVALVVTAVVALYISHRDLRRFTRALEALVALVDDPRPKDPPEGSTLP